MPVLPRFAIVLIGLAAVAFVWSLSASNYSAFATARVIGASSVAVGIILGVVARLHTARAGRNRPYSPIIAIASGIILVLGAIVPLHNKSSALRVARIQQQECAGRLQRVGSALRQYRENHAGRSPSRLSELYLSGYCDFGTLSCPLRQKNMSEAEFVAGLDDPMSEFNQMVYVDRASHGDQPIILCERIENHKVGSNVLLSDGSVRWLTREEVERRVNGATRIAPEK
jgi:hypothetical protein